MQCPVDAIGDSIVICKVGTVSVPGSELGTMNWTQFIQSIYNGGEGELIYCKTGEKIMDRLPSRELSLKNNKLLVDERFDMQVYDSINNVWLERVDIPCYRKTVYAMAGEIKVSADSMILKPPRHSKKAFASAAKNYEEERARTDHYLIDRTIDRLLSCAVCGDTLSASRLQNLGKDFAAYFSSSEFETKRLAQRLKLYHDYQQYLANGGKRVYFDMSIFPYFKKLADEMK